MKLIYILNDVRGGVYSVTNTLTFFQKDHDIKIIVCRNIDSNSHNNIAGFDNDKIKVVRFSYSTRENFFCIISRFKQLIDDDAIIIANDYLELKVINNCFFNNPVILVLHGDYDFYYKELAVNNQNIISYFFCVSDKICNKLKKLLPERKNDISYLRFPVKHVERKEIFSKHQTLKILFIGRLTKEKGYHLLPQINNSLKKKGIGVNWYIAGKLKSLEKEQKLWQNQNVQFMDEVDNKQLLAKLKNFDIFILPSIAEGMPISVIESMKAGLVPLVNNLESGISEIIINKVNGFVIENNCIDEYVEKIIYLDSHRKELESMAINASNTCNALFDPINNSREINHFIQKITIAESSIRLPKGNYNLSKLDKWFLPNFIVKFIRSVVNYDAY